VRAGRGERELVADREHSVGGRAPPPPTSHPATQPPPPEHGRGSQLHIGVDAAGWTGRALVQGERGAARAQLPATAGAGPRGRRAKSGTPRPLRGRPPPALPTLQEQPASPGPTLLFGVRRPGDCTPRGPGPSPHTPIAGTAASSLSLSVALAITHRT